MSESTAKQEIQEFLTARKREQENLDHAQQQISAHDGGIRRILGKKHSVSPHDIQLGGWECSDSLTGRCYYNVRGPMGDDECLVCGGPDERK
jgi:hypothetical protein